MKLITLNIWGGRVKEPFLSFIKKHSSVDIFCLQEVWHEAKNVADMYKGIEPNIFTEIKNILPTHEGYFSPALPGYGLSFFV